jgi:hypothetical protein
LGEVDTGVSEVVSLELGVVVSWAVLGAVWWRGADHLRRMLDWVMASRIPEDYLWRRRMHDQCDVVSRTLAYQILLWRNRAHGLLEDG